MVSPATPPTNPLASDEVLISGNCKCYLVRKTDFAGVIKLRILTWGDFPGLSEWPSIQAWCPNWRRAGGDHLPKAEQKVVAEIRVTCPRAGEGQQPPQDRRHKEWILLPGLQREQGAIDTLIWGIGPPESWQNKFPLFSGMELVMIG